MHYSNLSFNAITSFTLISTLHFHILLCSCTERWEKFAHIALFFTHLGPDLFFIFFFAEAGSHFISLIISLSTTTHKEIANNYFFTLCCWFIFQTFFAIIFVGQSEWHKAEFLNWKTHWDIPPKRPTKQSYEFIWVRVIRIELGVWVRRFEWWVRSDLQTK